MSNSVIQGFKTQYLVTQGFQGGSVATGIIVQGMGDNRLLIQGYGQSSSSSTGLVYSYQRMSVYQTPAIMDQIFPRSSVDSIARPNFTDIYPLEFDEGAYTGRICWVSDSNQTSTWVQDKNSSDTWKGDRREDNDVWVQDKDLPTCE